MTVLIQINFNEVKNPLLNTLQKPLHSNTAAVLLQYHQMPEKKKKIKLSRINFTKCNHYYISLS